MSILVTRRPHIFCFSKNPVDYIFTIDNFTDPGCFVQVQLYMRAIGGAPGSETLLHTETIKPAGVNVEYNVQDLVDAQLVYSTPDFLGNPIQTGFSHIKEFFVKYRRISDAETGGYWYSETDLARNIIKGGIEASKWDWNNYFISYVPFQHPFLTWQPLNRFVGSTDSFFITWLNSVTAPQPLSLLLTAEYSDGTVDTKLIDFPDTGENLLYHIMAGARDLGLLDLHPTLQLYKYSLQVVETLNTGNSFTKPYIYYIDYRTFYDTKYFHIYNSLGGLECIRIRGDVDYEVDRVNAEAEKYNDAIVIGSPSSEQYTQTSINKIDVYNGEVGYLHTAKEQDVLQELLMTRFAWEYLDFKNKRIYITSKNTKLRSNSDKKWSLTIQWRYGFTEVVYTPSDARMGAGADLETYLPPAGACPIATNLHSSLFEIFGLASITHYWDTPFIGALFEIQYKLSTDTVWIDTLSVTSPFYHMTSPGAGTFNWRVRTMCDTGFFSDWVNGDDIAV